MYARWDIKYISFNRDGIKMKKAVQCKNDPNKIKYSFIRRMFVSAKSMQPNNQTIKTVRCQVGNLAYCSACAVHGSWTKVCAQPPSNGLGFSSNVSEDNDQELYFLLCCNSFGRVQQGSFSG